MKVPCGGFDLDESVFNVDKNSKQLKLNSPISYDYMPEGYPKNDGWSIEWDGITEGKLYVPVEDYGLYKFSDTVLSADDLFGAKIIILNPTEMTGTITSDNVTTNPASDDVIHITIEIQNHNYVRLDFLCARKDNAYADGITYPEKGLYISGDFPYKFMIVKENITTMSTDFLPKNLNVVFRGELGHAPTSCNVTYNELRGWVGRDIPVFAVFITANAKFNITSISLLTDSLGFVYYFNGGTSKSFAYKSDGTFVIPPNQS